MTQTSREVLKVRKMLKSAEERANKKGLSFNLKEEDFLPLPTHCPVLGIRMRLPPSRTDPKGKPGGRDNSYSLDRRDNSLGYVNGNVFVISHRANAIKNSATLDEAQKVVRYMRGVDPLKDYVVEERMTVVDLPYVSKFGKAHKYRRVIPEDLRLIFFRQSWIKTWKKNTPFEKIRRESEALTFQYDQDIRNARTGIRSP